MEKRSVVFWAVLGLAAILLAACEFSVSTANIPNAFMAADHDGNQPTNVFAPDQVLYAIVDLANAPDDTTVRAEWIAVAVDADVEPNYLIDEATITGGAGRLTFTLENEPGMLWPIGDYRVDLYLNDEVHSSLEFQVQ